MGEQPAKVTKTSKIWFFSCLRERNPAMEMPAAPLCVCGGALQTNFKVEPVTPVDSPVPPPLEMMDNGTIDDPMMPVVEAMGGGELDPVQIPYQFPTVEEILEFLDTINQELHADWS